MAGITGRKRLDAFQKMEMDEGRGGAGREERERKNRGKKEQMGEDRERGCEKGLVSVLLGGLVGRGGGGGIVSVVSGIVDGGDE